MLVDGQPFFGFKDNVLHLMRSLFYYNSSSLLRPYLNPSLITIPNVI